MVSSLSRDVTVSSLNICNLTYFFKRLIIFILFCRLYSHSTGITHQPGFLAGSNFLLPWDVKVKSSDGGSSSVGGISNPKQFPRLFRGGRLPPRRIQRDEFNVKTFIGLEYECKRGHRFFVEGPGKALFHLNTSETLNKKEAANKVATTDMPLYTRCPCK